MTRHERFLSKLRGSRFASRVSFRAGGGQYHRAVAGGPWNDLALFFELRVWPTGYRQVVPTFSNRLRDF